MTDAEKQSLIDLLAEKVCGWTKQQSVHGRDYWRMGPHAYFEFAPLADPRDTELVMEAWHKQGFGLSIDMDSNATLRPWTAMTNYGDVEGACSEAYETMAEAVCVTIGRASGWDGERS